MMDLATIQLPLAGLPQVPPTPRAGPSLHAGPAGERRDSGETKRRTERAAAVLQALSSARRDGALQRLVGQRRADVEAVRCVRRHAYGRLVSTCA